MRRRHLLIAGAAGGGALLVGWAGLRGRDRVGPAELMAAPEGIALNGWIRIAPDGGVQLAMPRSEMGQGVHTALAMLVAEELDLPLARVQLVPAGFERLYGNVATLVALLPLGPRESEPGHETRVVRAARWVMTGIAQALGLNATGGSTSVADAWEPLRLAAATARARLLGAASLAWRLPVAELQCAGGVIRHASGEQAHFGQLAAQAAATPVSDVQPKAPADWTLIGTPAPRIDLPAKVDGRARYGIDVREPGQLFAVLVAPPALGGSPGAVDVAPALARPGVMRVVRLPPRAGADEALAVVAQSSWHAMQGAAALDVAWQPRPAGPLDSAAIAADLARTARAGGGFPFRFHGDVDAALAAAARRIGALYEAPYLPHLTMEPPNCTAQVHAGRVTVWAPTQVPGLARAIAAEVAGVDEDAVTLHVTYLGGGFGRRLEVDVVAQAVRVALETGGRPVQLLWPREADLGHDVYRPAAAAWLQAGLDAQGRWTVLSAHSAGDALMPRWLERNWPLMATRIDLPDRTASEGLFDLPYDLPALRVAHTATHHGVPVGNWRSVGHSHNAFFCEGFVDELAHASGHDPVAFRLGLLDGLPRHAAVLQLAAERAGWNTPAPAGVGRGVALHESFGTIVAQVAEVRADPAAPDRPRVLRIVAAVDCGIVVNPDGVAQQMESAVMFGLAAALHGRIDIVGGVVQQRNFPDQPPLTLAETPVIETHIVPSGNPPTGMGEPGVPPVAPAVANAWFALTGERRRRLPLGGQDRPPGG